MEEIIVVESERSSCNVSEEWIEKMSKRRARYSRTTE
jgi:hypothetical protein